MEQFEYSLEQRINKGNFFVFEGIDGGGKTTQINILKKKLKKQGHDVVVSKALMGSKKFLVNKFMHSFNFEKNSIPTMLLFQSLFARQAENVQEALKNNKIVLADRWSPSFWVFHQNFGPLKNKIDRLHILDEIAFRGLSPNLTFLLDIPESVAYERRKNRKIVDVFEQEALKIFSITRLSYLTMSKSKENWVIINADDSKKNIGANIEKEVGVFISKKKTD